MVLPCATKDGLMMSWVHFALGNGYWKYLISSLGNTRRSTPPPEQPSPPDSTAPPSPAPPETPPTPRHRSRQPISPPSQPPPNSPPFSPPPHTRPQPAPPTPPPRQQQHAYHPTWVGYTQRNSLDSDYQTIPPRGKEKHTFVARLGSSILTNMTHTRPI